MDMKLKAISSVSFIMTRPLKEERKYYKQKNVRRLI